MAKKRSSLKVLMLVENNPYPQDIRVRNEAVSLKRAGHDVTVIAPRSKTQLTSESVEGVKVIRFPAPPELGGALGYVVEYGYATVVMACMTFARYVSHGFDVIHAHNPPDTLALIAAPYKLLGKRFVYDLHDLSPEMYGARFQKTSGPVLWALKLLEQLSFRLADHVIATNESYASVVRQRGRGLAEDVSIVRNGPDLDRVRRVSKDPELRSRTRHLIGYVGVMGPQDGVDYLLRSLVHLRDDLGITDFLCVIVGKGDSLDALRSLSASLGLQDFVWFTGYVPDGELMQILSTVDLFVAPEPSNDFTDKSTMIKLTEYLVFGKPIVAFDLPEHRVTAGDAAHYAQANDELDFARKINELLVNSDLYAAASAEAEARLPSMTWEAQEPNLLAAYRTLTS